MLVEVKVVPFKIKFPFKLMSPVIFNSLVGLVFLIPTNPLTVAREPLIVQTLVPKEYCIVLSSKLYYGQQ